MPKLESLTREAAHLHRQRRRGHHQVHHGIGDHAAQRGRDEARLPRDLEQRPAAVQIRRRRLRRIDARQHRHRHQRDDGLHHEAEGEQIRRPDIHGPLHELRTEHAGEHAARHHPRHGLGPERGAGAVGGGKAIGLRHRAIEPAEKGRAAKQPERRVQDRERAEHAGQHAADGADDEGDAAAIGARDRAGRQRAGGEAEHVHRERHGRERDDRRQRRADDRAGGENHRRIGAGQRLRRRQPQHIGARTRVVGDLFGGCRIQHRHSRPAGPGRGALSIHCRHYEDVMPRDQPTQTGARYARGARWISHIRAASCLISFRLAPHRSCGPLSEDPPGDYQAGVREARAPVERDRRGEAEEAGTAHAELRGALVDPRNQALRQIDVHALGRIGRVDPDNEIGDDVGALGQRDLLDRRRRRQRPALLCDAVHRARQRGLRPLDRLFLRPPAGNAARKIGKPRAERRPRGPRSSTAG